MHKCSQIIKEFQIVPSRHYLEFSIHVRISSHSVDASWIKKVMLDKELYKQPFYNFFLKYLNLIFVLHGWFDPCVIESNYPAHAFGYYLPAMATELTPSRVALSTSLYSYIKAVYILCVFLHNIHTWKHIYLFCKSSRRTD